MSHDKCNMGFEHGRVPVKKERTTSGLYTDPALHMTPAMIRCLLNEVDFLRKENEILKSKILDLWQEPNK